MCRRPIRAVAKVQLMKKAPDIAHRDCYDFGCIFIAFPGSRGDDLCVAAVDPPRAPDGDFDVPTKVIQEPKQRVDGDAIKSRIGPMPPRCTPSVCPPTGQPSE